MCQALQKQLSITSTVLDLGGCNHVTPRHSGLNLNIQIQKLVFRFNSIQVPIIQYSGFIQDVISWQVLAEMNVSEVAGISTVCSLGLIAQQAWADLRHQSYLNRTHRRSGKHSHGVASPSSILPLQLLARLVGYVTR